MLPTISGAILRGQQCNVISTHIMQLSGHQNLQSVNNYSTLSKEQQKNVVDFERQFSPIKRGAYCYNFANSSRNCGIQLLHEQVSYSCPRSI